MEKFTPKVSIIIPVYNGANYMRDAIGSALGQTYSNVEVIIINDGSDDNGKTESIALSYGKRIRYYAKTNGGVATALNLGIEKMTGEYFSWLSHDDMYEKDKIEKQVQILSGLENKKTILLCGFSIIDETGRYLYEIDPLQQYSQKQLNTPLFALFRGAVHGCTLLIHKSHFDRIGVFNPSLPTTQDYDLFFRIMRGQSIFFHPGLFVKSRTHEEQDSKKKVSIHVKECGQLWIRMMQSITEDEMCAMEGSTYLFYRTTRDFLAGSAVPYTEAIEFATKKLEVLKEQSSVYEEEFFYQKLSRLLYDMTEHYNNQYITMESKYSVRIQELENRCKLYEQRLSAQKRTKGFKLTFTEASLLIKTFMLWGKAFVKERCVRIAKFVFHLVKNLTIRLGIKDRLKKSKLFRRLYKAGIVDKLRM